METKITKVTKAKGHTPQKYIPIVKIEGHWLQQYGFDYKKLVAVKSSKDIIELVLHESEVDLKRIRSKSGFIRVGRHFSKDKYTPLSEIHVKGFWLNDVGFALGTIVVAYVDHGRILIKALDMTPLQQEALCPHNIYIAKMH